MSQETTEDDLIAYFASFGKIKHATLLPDNETGRHRGFAFVTFEDEAVAEAVARTRYHVIRDKQTEVKRAQAKRDALAIPRQAAKMIGPELSGSQLAAPPLMQLPTLQPQIQPQTLQPAALFGANHSFQAFVNNALSNAFVTLQQNLASQQYLPSSSSARFSPYPVAAPLLHHQLDQQQQQQGLFSQQQQQQGPYVQQQQQQPLYPVQSLFAAAAAAQAVPDSTNQFLADTAANHFPSFLHSHAGQVNAANLWFDRQSAAVAANYNHAAAATASKPPGAVVVEAPPRIFEANVDINNN